MPELHCETLRYPSADGSHKVAAFIYMVPGVPVRAVVQLSHGMCEYIRRYRPMAEWYAARGVAVAGNDHLGHGDTADPGEYGHYGTPRGRENLLNDLHRMNTLLHRRFPGTPVVLYGHSMGSFYARWYAETWPDTIAALILSGTAGPSAVNAAGRVLASAMAAIKGEKYISPLFAKLNFGSYNKRIPDAASPNAWLTTDAAVVAAYDADPLCGFPFTVGSYREMLTVLCHVNTRAWARRMPKDLPVLLIAGGQDPVGAYGAGVRAVWAMLGDAGVHDLTCQIWPDGRHEMHNEPNRDEVFDYCLTWITDHLPAPAGKP